MTENMTCRIIVDADSDLFGRCPVCGSSHVEHVDTDYFDNSVSLKNTCHDCHSIWWSDYTYKETLIASDGRYE